MTKAFRRGTLEDYAGDGIWAVQSPAGADDSLYRYIELLALIGRLCAR